ncbi:hypothetical protein EIP91_011475 [Steccherinum ochraceum]|uniref:Uncharacterized protein n=1 Tax=Steccherinum ochraceum TaxID=92696 RepID=A0A4V6N6Z7_9APHY|nr:hypothetical protein EIP91_011475 [Steccherinum ochraceum]
MLERRQTPVVLGPAQRCPAAARPSAPNDFAVSSLSRHLAPSPSFVSVSPPAVPIIIQVTASVPKNDEHFRHRAYQIAMESFELREGRSGVYGLPRTPMADQLSRIVAITRVDLCAPPPPSLTRSPAPTCLRSFTPVTRSIPHPSPSPPRLADSLSAELGFSPLLGAAGGVLRGATSIALRRSPSSSLRSPPAFSSDTVVTASPFPFSTAGQPSALPGIPGSASPVRVCPFPALKA